MALQVPESHRDLLNDEAKAFAVLATIMPDGSPQLTPLWFDVEGDNFRVNTSRGRVKDRNLSARPKVALAIIDPRNPYRYIQVRGTVVEARERGAREHIDRLNLKYHGVAKYNGPADQTRVTYVIRPDHISVMG